MLREYVKGIKEKILKINEVANYHYEKVKTSRHRPREGFIYLYVEEIGKK